MPHKKPQLAANQIDALVQWVKMGLPWPKEAAVAHAKPKWEEHWAFLPVRKPAVPEITKYKSQNTNKFQMTKNKRPSFSSECWP